MPKTLVFIFLVGLVQNTSYGMIAPFIPLQLELIGCTPGQIGAIFAVYALSGVFWAPVVSNVLLKKFNGRTLMWTGMFLMGMVFISFSLIETVISKVWIIVMWSIILRLLQGIAGCTM
jgi:MFS family permease